jgi:hypothetical protein
MALELAQVGPEFLSEVGARTGLETPQAVLSWTFAGLETPITDGVPWDWKTLDIRRSDDRYPESKSEGVSILSEAFGENPSTSVADLTPTALLEHYYSLFLTYREHATNNVSLDQDVRRLGAEFAGVVEDERRLIIPAISDGSTSTGTALVTSATATFLTDGVQAGFYVEIADGGADDGFYRIVSVNSETSLTIDTALTLTVVGTVDFKIYTDHDNLWIAGIDYHRKQSLWLWDTRTQKCDYKIDLSEILNLDEKIVGLAYAGVIGGTRSIAFVTNTRYVRVPDDILQPVTADIIDQWTLSGSGLTPGYQVTGASVDPSIFLGSDYVYLLDASNEELVVVTETAGALFSKVSLSGLDDTSSLKGVAFDFNSNVWMIGNHNYVYKISTGGDVTDHTRVTGVSYTRNTLLGDIGYRKDPLTDVVSYLTVEDQIDRVQAYDDITRGRGFLWQQPYVADAVTVALYHLNEASGAVVDTGPYSNNGTNSGMTQDSDGYFGKGYESTLATHSVDISSISSDFSSLVAHSEGSLSLWFKATDGTTLTSGTSVLADLRVDASNLVRIGVDSGSLVFEYVAGGTSKLVSVAHPSTGNTFQLERWHHYKITWSVFNDQVRAYVDGIQVGTTQTSLGVWAGVIATATIGATAAAAIGTYDEVHVSATPRVVLSQADRVTSANRMHAFSGRDYDAAYEDDDPLGFHYRDEVFTEKFMGGRNFITRNDFDKTQLSPADKVMDDSEVIFRGPSPLPELGDLGRCSRMIGLFIDRIADDRERHLFTTHDRYRTEVEDIPKVAEYLGIPGLDETNWNVDLQRRFLRIMPLIMKRGGRSTTYVNFARLLSYLIESRTLQARRRWDSVIYSAVVPLIQAIPLDVMGSMDTIDETFPLAILRFCMYRRSTRSTLGSTSVFTGRLLTDTTATFRDTCQIGNLISINTPSNDGDDGDYIVVEIHSDTVLKVDRDWGAGSLSNLTYTNNWEVPRTDPDGEFLLTRFLDVAPDSMLLKHLECKIADELPGSTITPGDGLHPKSGGYVTP